MKNNIVITGVLGYIGFNLLVTLLRLGYNVVGVDRNAENGQVKRYFDTTGFQCCGISDQGIHPDPDRYGTDRKRSARQ